MRVEISPSVDVTACALALVALVTVPLPSAAARAQQTEARAAEDYGCIICHADKRRAFTLGVHSERGIRCHDCHGGDPASFDRPAAHAGAFSGDPSKAETIQICSSCHSDPDQMRQYGLPSGQLAEFRTSRHGQLLLDQGNTDAPACTDCHDAHTILRPNDARSSVYPTNISATCAGCHNDESLMARYDLPIGQIEQHRNSTHGKALFEERNFAAPTCVSCHGSHAALPPAVVEITNVCGQCHVLVRRAFYSGPHGEATRAGQLSGCTECHSNHGTEAVVSAQIDGVCSRCHDDADPARKIALEMQEQVTSSAEELRSAEEAIGELVAAGRQVADIRFRYRNALTIHEQLAQAQHSLDLETLEDMSRRVASHARQIRGSAEVAAEQRWEHKLYLVPIWFLALAAIVLAWFRLRRLHREYY